MLFGTEGHEFSQEKAEQMCNDLWDAYRRMAFLLTGEKTSFNPLKAGLSLPTCLHMAIDGFRRLIPKKYDFNIDHSKHEPNETYHFTIYRYCPGWGSQRAAGVGQWLHILPIGNVLQVLAVKNRPLHDLFLCFIRLFSQSTGIPLWDGAMTGFCVEHLDERLINLEGDASPEEVQGIRNDIELYNRGIAAEYGKRILSAKRMEATELRNRARRFKSRIANIIFEGAELLLSRHRLYDFYYMEEYFEDSCYLELDSQAVIIWQEEDNLHFELNEYVEAMANEGIQEPVAYFIIDKYLKQINMDDLEARTKWPGQLSAFLDRSYQEILKFNENERINGKAAHKSPRPSGHCRVRCEF